MIPEKVLFSDIDGTLLNPERELSFETKEQIKRIKDSYPFVLISSRMPSAMLHLQKELDIADQPMICYNGGLILINGQIKHSTFINTEILSDLIEFNDNLGVHLSLYYEDSWYVPQLDKWAEREINNTKVKPEIKPNTEVLKSWKTHQIGAHKVMCMGDETKVDIIFDFLSSRYGDKLHLYRSKPTYIEIAHKEISKLTAIEFLLEKHFKIPIENTVAFGDNYNDIAMLKAVGTGVAVANAKTEVLDIADYITSAGKENGVADYIKTHII